MNEEFHILNVPSQKLFDSFEVQILNSKIPFSRQILVKHDLKIFNGL
jgi:hypothetical protein